MRRALHVLSSLCMAAAAGSAGVAQAAPPVTVAEASGFTQTATGAEVEAFLQDLAGQSARVTLDVLGRTHDGRDIPLAIIAEPPVASAEDARRSGRLLVLIIGNIHAGEVCGKEASLMLARDLALDPEPGVLDDLIVAVVPNYNADGNDDMAPDHRPGQDGPERMGTRANAQGLDLNRDWVKLDAPETRAMVRFLNEWDPAVVIDTHTTNGSRHRFAITYQGPKHPAGDADIVEHVRDVMLPAVDKAFEAATGWNAFVYGNFAQMHTRWATYPAEPRYGVGYRGLRNRVTILSEAYAYAPFEERVRATHAFCREVLAYAARRAVELRDLTDAADRRHADYALDPAAAPKLALRVEAVPLRERAIALGFDENADPAEPRDYEVEVLNLFEPSESVPRAYAYVLPPDLTPIVHHLQRHGVEVSVLREDLDVDAEVDAIKSFTRAERRRHGRVRVADVAVERTPRATRLDAGAYVVRTGQPLGALASYLLEPRAADGLLAWGFFDPWLHEGAVLPVKRLPNRTPMTLRPARPLPEDREAPRPITYDDVHGDDRINLSGDPVSGLRWLDDDRFLQRKDADLWIVEAVTGRAAPFEWDPSDVAARLAELPTIDADEAERIADRRFANVDPDAPGVVFRHAGDLYFAHPDGAGAVRLTSSPDDEELAELSPDGRFVAFVRNNDLWVVDTPTATERRLTTGGRDDLRHGKASWVYFEEVFRRSWKAFWWSPDARSIAFLITDSARVPEFTIVDDAKEPQRIEVTRYPKPGQPNPHVEAAIVDVRGGPVRPIDLSGYDEGGYLVTQLDWSEATGRLRLSVQDRAQTWLDLLEVGPRAGEPTRLFRETTGAWVTPIGRPIELDAGGFLRLNERDGYRHIHHHAQDGALIRRITEGPWEVRTIHHVDEDDGWIYWSGTLDSSLASNLYRVRLDGDAPPERLTREPGTHRASLSPNAELFIDSWSSRDHPTRVALRSASGALVRMLDTNPVYELDAYDLGRIEFLQVPSDAAGVPHLEAALVYPPDFDPARTYPVWFRTYAGPHAPTVRDSWSGGRLFDRMLAEQGIVVFLGDPHSASGKGAASAWRAYRRLGAPELDDVRTLIGWLHQQPWADRDRIGMSGHSYGGFMTAYAMTHTELFSAGVAGAPVTSWRDYDTIYTERYMDTPQRNPDGYAETSVVSAAEHLHGRLLLLHGTMDDNVHMQNSIKLADALRRAEKQFDMFIYPGFRHGLRNPHYHRLVYDFIIETMLGPRTGPPPGDAPPSTGAPSTGDEARGPDAR